MAIYKYDDSFYLNAVSGSYFSENPKHVTAHELSKGKIEFLVKVYRLSTVVCFAALPFSLWFGAVSRITRGASSFLYINVLITIIGITIFSILFVTLALRSSATTVDLSRSELAVSESVIVYLYYLAFSLNLFILLTTAPWGSDIGFPTIMIPGIAYFLCALLFSIYRLILIRKWLSRKCTLS
ncbi:MAG: hypothetical protein A3H44_13235 [Gammaproteobacteria bacterium RIFCSPLOWO2_02_FULL_57_10]|nr:MAG: hypothetical protein A3H44_13235 [Gammaproteobacteria bacterium RIFCSPLOWO2_02_FULL_57_10]